MGENMSILQINNISKRYAGVQALNDVSVEFEAGKVHALVGENGAGKSTLIKIISGAETPDSGELVFEGKSFSKVSPFEARELGVATIYQEFNLFSTLTVAENIYLGDELLDKNAPKLFNLKEYAEKAQTVLDSMGVAIKPTQSIDEMTTASMQLVEIAKAVAKNAKILIMDEPTAPLSVKETEDLFKLIKRLKSNGVAIIYISHRLDEIFTIADTVTVMRDGKIVATNPVEKVTRLDIIRMMANREVEEIEFESPKEKGKVVLEVKNLCGNGLKDISFSVREGEIFGLGGLLGAGRTEIARLIFGADKLESGQIFIDGKETQIGSPKEAVKHGIAYVPEDRKHHGAILNLPINWNITLPILPRISKAGFIDRTKDAEISEKQKTDFLIKTNDTNNHVSSLSGGNQQKVVLAKWLASNPRILILDEPTRGVDVNARQEIYQLISQFAEQGMAIVFISSEIDELLNITDRMLVLFEKREVGFLEKSEYSQTRVLAMGSGVV